MSKLVTEENVDQLLVEAGVSDRNGRAVDPRSFALGLSEALDYKSVLCVVRSKFLDEPETHDEYEDKCKRQKEIMDDIVDVLYMTKGLDKKETITDRIVWEHLNSLDDGTVVFPLIDGREIRMTLEEWDSEADNR